MAALISGTEEASKEPSGYQYHPLKPASLRGGEFRLLTLCAGLPGSKIRCKLRHASLDSGPEYEALSYTWGDPRSSASVGSLSLNPPRTYQILLDEGVFTITHDLHAALEQLRYTDKDRVLWVDAVCINQSDGIERMEQVKLMGKSYQRASHVLSMAG